MAQVSICTAGLMKEVRAFLGLSLQSCVVNLGDLLKPLGRHYRLGLSGLRHTQRPGSIAQRYHPSMTDNVDSFQRFTDREQVSPAFPYPETLAVRRRLALQILSRT